MAKDIDLPEPPEIDWGPQNQGRGLQALADYAAQYGQASIGWYQSKRGRKKRGGQILRVGAILFLAVAGVIPVLGEIWTQARLVPATVSESSDSAASAANPNIQERIEQPVIPAAWAAIAIAIAALLGGLDKFWGHTSAWVRYIKADLLLQELFSTFVMDWNAAKVVLKDGQPNEKQVLEGIALCKSYVLGVHEVVRKETDQWAAEFDKFVRTMDDAAKSKNAGEAPKPKTP